jgi:erythromycin esterase-like protein
MMETLEALLARAGPRSRALVWAHNTHVGDARATDMADEGMVNLGQLCRERFGADQVFIAGFATHRGSVVAARAWDAPWQRMPLPPAMPGSWEAALHETTGGEDALFLLRGRGEGEVRGQRAVGVVYHPERERGNYVPTDLAARYDALLFLDETRALAPLHTHLAARGEPPETWPTGL